MVVAIPFTTRRQIVQLRSQGKSYQPISQKLDVSYDAVRRICKRNQQQSESGEYGSTVRKRHTHGHAYGVFCVCKHSI